MFKLVNADPPFSKALPSKIDYERLSPYFKFRPHDVTQHTLQQTTQLAKSNSLFQPFFLPKLIAFFIPLGN
jgi:hypothetical protein